MSSITLIPTEEFCTLEYILLGDLGDLLSEPMDEQNRKWLIAVLDALLDTLPRESCMEDDDDYLSEVLDRYPNWSRQVSRLRDDHERLFAQLKVLRTHMSHEAPLNGFARQIRHDLREWMELVRDHHHNEGRLLQMAWNLEVGTGD